MGHPGLRLPGLWEVALPPLSEHSSLKENRKSSSAVARPAPGAQPGRRPRDHTQFLPPPRSSRPGRARGRLLARASGGGAGGRGHVRARLRGAAGARTPRGHRPSRARPLSLPLPLAWPALPGPPCKSVHSFPPSPGALGPPLRSPPSSRGAGAARRRGRRWREPEGFAEAAAAAARWRTSCRRGPCCPCASPAAS